MENQIYIGYFNKYTDLELLQIYTDLQNNEEEKTVHNYEIYLDELIKELNDREIDY